MPTAPCLAAFRLVGLAVFRLVLLAVWRCLDGVSCSTERQGLGGGRTVLSLLWSCRFTFPPGPVRRTSLSSSRLSTLPQTTPPLSLCSHRCETRHSCRTGAGLVSSFRISTNHTSCWRYFFGIFCACLLPAGLRPSPFAPSKTANLESFPVQAVYEYENDENDENDGYDEYDRGDEHGGQHDGEAPRSRCLSMSLTCRRLSTFPPVSRLPPPLRRAEVQPHQRPS